MGIFRSGMRWRSRLMLLSGCLGACAMSVPVFSYGSMAPYIYSYLWMQGQRFDIYHLNLHPSLFLMFVTSCGSVIGLLSKVMNERILYAIFSALLTLIMLSLYWFGTTYIALSIYMCAIGFCGGNVLVYTIGKVNYMTLQLIAGISGFIGSFICTVYVNPNNVQTQRVFDPAYPELGNVTIFTDPAIYDKVPWLWVIFAVMFTALFLPSVIIVRYNLSSLCCILGTCCSNNRAPRAGSRRQTSKPRV
eukprot:sb/3468860/